MSQCCVSVLKQMAEKETNLFFESGQIKCNNADNFFTFHILSVGCAMSVECALSVGCACSCGWHLWKVPHIQTYNQRDTLVIVCRFNLGPNYKRKPLGILLNEKIISTAL